MAAKKTNIVTMRVKIGESELEVTGPQDFVDKKIAEFIESVKSIPNVVESSHERASVKASGTVESSGKRMAINQFMKKLTKKTDVDRVLAAGFYFEKHRNYDSFTAAEIRDAIKEAKIKPPTNTSDAINKNIKKGYMMAAGDKDGKMGFVLTTDGEQHVEDLTHLAG